MLNNDGGSKHPNVLSIVYKQKYLIHFQKEKLFVVNNITKIWTKEN